MSSFPPVALNLETAVRGIISAESRKPAENSLPKFLRRSKESCSRIFLILPRQLLHVIIYQLLICFQSSDRLCLSTCTETFCFVTQIQWKALYHWTGLDGHLIALHLCALWTFCFCLPNMGDSGMSVLQQLERCEDGWLVKCSAEQLYYLSCVILKCFILIVLRFVWGEK